MESVSFKTTGEVKTFCEALGLAQHWSIMQLRLPSNMAAEGWEALSSVAGRGLVDNVCVDELGLGAANDTQICDLWKITVKSDGFWWCQRNGVIANRREGDAGLQRLLATRR